MTMKINMHWVKSALSWEVLAWKDAKEAFFGKYMTPELRKMYIDKAWNCTMHRDKNLRWAIGLK